MLMDCRAEFGVGLLMMSNVLEEHVCEVVIDFSPVVEMDVFLDCLFAKYDLLYL